MNRFAAGALVLAMFLLGTTASASAAEPAGPRLAVIANSADGSKALTVGPRGEDPRKLLSDPDYWWFGGRVSWPTAGDQFSFLVSGPFDASGPIIGVAKSDGSGSEVFPHAFPNEGDPVMAPDGKSVFFQRSTLVKERENYFFATSLWSLDLADGSVRRRTRWIHTVLVLT